MLRGLVVQGWCEAVTSTCVCQPRTSLTASKPVILLRLDLRRKSLQHQPQNERRIHPRTVARHESGHATTAGSLRNKTVDGTKLRSCFIDESLSAKVCEGEFRLHEACCFLSPGPTCPRLLPSDSGGVLKLLEAADLPAKDAHGPDAWRQLSNFLGGAPRAGRSVVKLTHHGCNKLQLMIN